MYTVPSFAIGCYVIEGFFSSSLQCYFQQSCLDAIYDKVHSAAENPLNVTAMHYNSTESQYNITTELQVIVENLMLENWNDQTSFESYFSQCNPQTCTYTYYKQADVRYMITTIVGFFGGLTAVFRLIIPALVKLWWRKKRATVVSGERDGKHELGSLLLGRLNTEYSWSFFSNSINQSSHKSFTYIV